MSKTTHTPKNAKAPAATSAITKPQPKPSTIVANGAGAGQGKTPAPDWLIETPMPTHYTLTMWDDQGGNEQDVMLNRREFIALKRHLAEMRGHEVPEDIDDFFGRLVPEGQ